MVLAPAGTSHLPLTAVCVVLAGAGCPPLEDGLRSLWPALLPDAAHVRTAYTLDASPQEIFYVTGPALAITVTGWLSPSAARPTAEVQCHPWWKRCMREEVEGKILVAARMALKHAGAVPLARGDGDAAS